MEIRCRCTGCSAKFKVEAKYAGKKARCPKCQAIVEVPLTSGDETVTVPTVVGPAPSTLAPTLLTPTSSGTTKLATPKHAPTTIAIPVVKGATPETTPPREASQAASPPAPASADENCFPTFATVTPNPSSTPAAGGHAQPPRGRKKARLLPLYIGGALTAIVAVMALVLLFALGSGGAPTAKKEKSGTANKSTANSDGTLLLDWPQGERSGGAVVIDGKRRAIAATGALKFPLPPGEHKVVALRRGFEPFDTTFNVAPRESTTIAPAWTPSTVDEPPSRPGDFPVPSAISVAGFDGWPQDFEKAKRAAAAAKKDLLIVFGCSDNDSGTQELARHLAQAGVLQSHVCVVLDFPDTTRGLDVVADQGQNHLVAEQFGVRSIPTLALADDQGRAYFLKREWNDGFGATPSKIAEWSKLKTERDALLAAAGQAADPAQLAAAATATKWLQEKHLARTYQARIDEWYQGAQKVDPTNERGQLEVLFESHWALQVGSLDSDDSAAVQRLMQEFNDWEARPFQDPDRGARLRIVAAQMFETLKRPTDALKQIELALAAKPKNPDLIEFARRYRVQLQNRDILGNGSGFLVSSAGFVITNRHVAEMPGRLEILIPETDQRVPATVFAKSDSHDIALLKVDLTGHEDLPVLPVTGSFVGRGTPVAAFGFPQALRLGLKVTQTSGTIAAKPEEQIDSMYKLQMTINGGNSGGPLCDNRGNVVGLVAAKTRTALFGDEDSYGLAIPSPHVLEFLDEKLPQDAKRPALFQGPGLDWTEVDDRMSRGVFLILAREEP